MNGRSLTPARLERIQELFHAAAEQPPEQRAEVVREGSPDDPSLQQEVLALLAAHDRAEERFVSPITPGAVRAAAAAERWIGVRLGAYEITRRIGDGGMGTVYEAVRADEEFSRRVAIKLLRRGLESDLALRRFRNERQILANLTHPNIAALLDGGTTADGQPYIVMEYVDGAPITRWCDDRRLPVRERVELFAQVCAAVQYAHQNRVVHRDLKPGNILVTADGTVKLLDFGIAKLLAATAETASDPTMTQVGQRAFTPDYAAPEQFREKRVGIPADVYALGGVLFELLTGRRPFELEGKSFAEVERTVCEADAPRPSLTLRSDYWQELGERSASRARVRIAGDLDAIVLMALRKEPERRYPSVEQLRRDLLEHAAGRSVIARPESVTHRLRKWVLRHRLEVGVAVLALVLLIGGAATAALAAVSLLGGIAATGWQARRAQAEARLAEQAARDAQSEKARAEQVRDFLRTMLGAADGLWTGPQPGTRPDITVGEVLNRASAKADEQFGEQPELESEIRRTLGISYRSLGRFREAVEQFEAAIALDRSRLAGPSRDLASNLYELGSTLRVKGDLAGAEAAMRASIAEFERADATTERGYAIVHNDLGITLLGGGDQAGARPLLLRANELARRHLGEASPVVAISHSNLGITESDLGNVADAERHYRSALETYERMDAHTLAEPAAALGNLALLAVYSGRFDEAEALIERALEILDRTVGDDHFALVWVRLYRVTLRYFQGRYAAAESELNDYLEIIGRLYDPENPAMAAAYHHQGIILNATGRAVEAEAHLRRTLAIRQRGLPAGNWRLGVTAAALGRSLLLQDRLAEAAPLLEEGYACLVDSVRITDIRTREAAGWLAELYDALGDPERAAEYRSRSAPA